MWNERVTLIQFLAYQSLQIKSLALCYSYSHITRWEGNKIGPEILTKPTLIGKPSLKFLLANCP